jgi:hypothetical protein
MVYFLVSFVCVICSNFHKICSFHAPVYVRKQILAVVRHVTHHVRLAMDPVKHSASHVGQAAMLCQEHVQMFVLMDITLTRSAVSASNVL